MKRLSVNNRENLVKCLKLLLSRKACHFVSSVTNLKSLLSVRLKWVICDKYCMAHGCATRKNIEGLRNAIVFQNW